MTKKIIIILLPLMLLATIAKAEGEERTVGYFSTQIEPVEWNRELPRTQTIIYDSEQKSRERSMEPSIYFQPLEQKWQISSNGQAQIFKQEYKMPFVWVDREVFLYIGATGGAYDIVINGKYVAYNQNRAISAEFNITADSKEGINTLEIIVYTDYAASVIEREKGVEKGVGEVYIISQPRVRIRDYTARINFEGDDANVELGVIMKSHLLNPKEYRVFYRLLSPEGELVAQGYRDAAFSMMSEDTVRFVAKVPNVQKWSHESPHLYTLLLKTQHMGRFGEYLSYDIGMRTVDVSDSQLHINSRATSLYVSPSITEEYRCTSEQLDDLKKQGYNAIKVSRPMHPSFYQMCDKKGIYVINQTDIATKDGGISRAKGGNPSNNPILESVYRDRTLVMYHGSKNYASVIGFSLAENSANGYNLYRSYKVLKELEKNRPIIYMESDGEWNSDIISADIAKAFPYSVGERIVLNIGERNNVSTNPEPTLQLIDEEQGIYRIGNQSQLADLHGELTYTLKQGIKVVSEGKLEFNVEPQSCLDVNVPLGKAKPNRKIKYEVTMESRLR